MCHPKLFWSHEVMNFDFNVFLQQFFGWMNVSEWFAMHCLQCTRRQLHIFLEQLVFLLYLFPLLFCMFFHLCVMLNIFWMDNSWTIKMIDEFCSSPHDKFWNQASCEVCEEWKTRQYFVFRWDSFFQCKYFFDSSYFMGGFFGGKWKIQWSLILIVGIYAGLISLSVLILISH